MTKWSVWVSTPPRARNRAFTLASDVHYDVAEREKQTRRQGLCEKIRKIVFTPHVGDRELEIFHFFTYEEVATMDVLGTRVMLRVVRQVDGRLVVEMQRGRVARVFAELFEERSEIRGLFCSLGGCDDFCLARRKGDARLFLGGPRNGRLVVHENVSGG